MCVANWSKIVLTALKPQEHMTHTHTHRRMHTAINTGQTTLIRGKFFASRQQVPYLHPLGPSGTSAAAEAAGSGQRRALSRRDQRKICKRPFGLPTAFNSLSFKFLGGIHKQPCQVKVVIQTRTLCKRFSNLLVIKMVKRTAH